MRRIAVFAFALIGASLYATPNTFLSTPDIHGDQVVFTSEGDLWLGSVSGLTARRITSHAGTESNAKFSPDGTQIAFTANYEGGREVYVMPVRGGAPVRLTFGAGNAVVQGWSPDGQQILYRCSRNNALSWKNRLWTVPARGGLSTLLKVPRGEFGSLAANGMLVYVPTSAEWMNWFHYEGGAADQVWLTDLKNGTFRQLTHTKGISTSPIWMGGKIILASDTGVQVNLQSLDPNSGKTVNLTKYTDSPIRYPSSDGKRVVYQHGYTIGLYDPATGVAKDLAFDLNSDRIHTRTQRVSLAPYVSSVALGPTGKRVAIEARGQILTVATKEGDARVILNTPGVRYRLGAWSPDGKKLVVIGDQTGEQQLYIVDLSTNGEIKPLTKDLKTVFNNPIWSPDGKQIAVWLCDGRFLLIDAATGATKTIDQDVIIGSYDSVNREICFSPDSKLIAYKHSVDLNFTEVKLYEVATGKTIRVSPEGVNAYRPAFDPDGKALFYLADRDFKPGVTGLLNRFNLDNTTRISMVLLKKEPSPFLPQIDEEGAAEKKPDAKPLPVDLEGLATRFVDIPVPGGRYTAVIPLSGKLLITQFSGVTNMEEPAAKQDLLAFDFEKKSLTTLAGGLDAVDISNDHKRLLITRGSIYSVIDVPGGPANVNEGNLKLDGIVLTVDPEKEWKQIFNESWRAYRDFFYDPNMHGVDWNAIKTKYEALLPNVGSRQDLSRIISDMISEVHVGHAYNGDPTPGASGGPALGCLGVDLEPVPNAAAVKITKILKSGPYDVDVRSPFVEPGVDVKEGEYIVAVAGTPVNPSQDVNALLIGTAGRMVSLLVNDKPTTVGARTVRIKPLSKPDENKLRYFDWVEGRADYVRKKAGPTFGYLHMSDMGTDGAKGFLKGLWPNLDKDALVLDIRDNGGGWISMMVLDYLLGRQTSHFKIRYGGDWWREQWKPIGRTAVIINEGNFSDGEFFPTIYRTYKLGPIVGKRTGGGEVGSGGGYRLIDNGSVFIPNYGAYLDGKWIVEGYGCPPDVEVDQDPAKELAGEDPQLDKTIELLKADLAKNPIKRQNPPPYPNKAVKS